MLMFTELYRHMLVSHCKLKGGGYKKYKGEHTVQ